MTTTLNRYALAVVRQEAAARGWSRKRLCTDAHIRQVAMRGRKPLDIEEIFRAGEVVGVGGWAILTQVSKAWEEHRLTAADSARRR